MIKFFVSLAATLIFSFALGLYLPWWSIAISAFLVSFLIDQKPVWGFLSGFLALFLLWGAMAWWRSAANDHILAHRLSLLIFSINNPAILILVTTLAGAITGGLGALTGSLLRIALIPRTEAE